MPLNCTFKMVKNGTFYVIYLYTHTHTTQNLFYQSRRGWGSVKCSHGFAFPFVFKRTTSIFSDFHTKAHVGVGSTPSCPPISQKPTWKLSKLFKV